MNRSSIPRFISAVSLAACLVCFTCVEAKKPDKPGGGGGDGGKDTTPARFTLLELPLDGHPFAISESTQGTITVAVDSSEDGYASAAFVRVDRNTQKVLDFGFLPEPPFADPNTGAFKNGYSGPIDVNDAGTIVGYAAAFEDDPDYTGPDINPQRGTVWTFDGTDYSYELLPTLNLAPTYANGINNLGEIVGSSDNRAVLWDAGTHAIEDLNDAYTASLGWELLAAHDINDAGLVVGLGMLAGKLRGFVLDLDSGLVWTVPLVGPTDANSASRINANGRVVGTAWDGEGVHYGTDPDYVHGYSWDGPGSDPVALTSVTNNTSMGVGMNDLGASTGHSFIPQDDPFANDTVPTLWEFDEAGQLAATDLTTEVENLRSWLLLRCFDVNNDGWVSVFGRKRGKGGYEWRAVLLIPNL